MNSGANTIDDRRRVVYLDNNATTAALPEVVTAMLPWFTESYANASSTHAAGERAADAVRAARASVARLLNARSPSEVVFTSGGTESINTALRAAARAGRAAGRRTLVTATTEHSAVLETLESLQNEGFSRVCVPVDAQGRYDRDALFAAIDGDTALVSLLLANNETGVVNDLAGVGARCREAGVAFHVDAVQAAGKLPLDVRAIEADLVSISAHKVHGPKGVGALWIRDGFECAPLLHGGSQERRVRPGTENVPGIVGFGVAAEHARAFVADAAACEALARRRDRFERAVCAAVDESNGAPLPHATTDASRGQAARVHGAGAPRVANTTNVALGAIDAEAFLVLASELGLYASAGSACHAQARKPSHVLLAMGVDESAARASVRFSLSRHTTDAEIDRALEIVREACRILAN